MTNLAPNIGEAAAIFLAEISPKDKAAGQISIGRFASWYGQKKLISKLTAPDVAAYSNRLSPAAPDYKESLSILRAFLSRAKKEGWIKQSLSGHLKTRKPARSKAMTARQKVKGDFISLEGYREMEVEVAELREKRIEVVADISRAAADKDFRENAPLAAAKEQCGHIEGRIKELEEALKTAVVIEEGAARKTSRAAVGDTVFLKDQVSGREVCYTLVSPREVDISQGKISNASPIGRAIMGTEAGEIVEITIPAGKLCYRIERVGH